MNDIYTISGESIPLQLHEIPQPPLKLFVRGSLPRIGSKILCIVGAREYSEYGRDVVHRLISGLQHQNICIVSGLAKGIDGLVHKKALEFGIQTIAFPGSGLDESVLYPKQNIELSRDIIKSGGGLISELEPISPARDWTFPLRNRLMAGISDATIVIEAKLPSGSLITTRLAHEYNRDVGAVPGDIRSALSNGPNWLLGNYAMPITCSQDILDILRISR